MHHKTTDPIRTSSQASFKFPTTKEIKNQETNSCFGVRSTTRETQVIYYPILQYRRIKVYTLRLYFKNNYKWYNLTLIPFQFVENGVS
jgi:hypothetical protein